MTTSPPNFAPGPESDYSGVVPLGEPSDAESARPPIPKDASRVREITAAGLAVSAAVVAVVSTLLPYEKFGSASAKETPAFTVQLTSWRQAVSPSPEVGWDAGSVALFGIPYSLAAVVLLVSAGLLLGVAGTKGRRIARLTITAGATAALSMFAMMAANVFAFVSAGENESAKAAGITYESGPGIWGFLIVAVLAVGAAVLALLPTAEAAQAEMATPPMGIPMPQASQVQPQAPQVAEILESPANK
ncbi:MAG: hypothetical protein QOI21_3471 [Actinomycetota bacterium]|nr:hypothetical protein [Actinomycetota bacterium]